jgi:hypothetical protein
MASLFHVAGSHLAFIWPVQHIMGLGFREEAEMATMTLRTHQKQSTNRDSRGVRARIDAFVRDSVLHAVAEGSRARVFGLPHSDRAVAPNTDGGESHGEGSTPLSVPFARHVEPLPRAALGLGRKIARFILTASLTLVVLAGTVALQAAIHVYVWHLAG